MKNLFFIKKNKAFTFLVIIFSSFSLLFLSSCLKESNSNEESIASALTVINGAPDAPAIDFVLNRELVLPNNVAYAQRMIYFTLFSGNSQARFYEHNTYENPLYSVAINLTRGKYYSLFLAGLKADSLSSLLIEDDLSGPKEGKAKLRFLNLSPDAGSLDFSIVEDSLFASQKKFKEYTSFYEIEAGNYSATFKSNSGELVNYNFELNLEKGRIYTVWARGLVETDNEKQKFENGLIIHDLRQAY